MAIQGSIHTQRRRHTKRQAQGVCQPDKMANVYALAPGLLPLFKLLSHPRLTCYNLKSDSYACSVTYRQHQLFIASANSRMR